MASAALRKLWKLHQIDLALVEMRKRAATLDVGQSLAAEIQALQTRLDSNEGAKAKALSAEQLDIELEQQGLDEKIQKFDRQLYGGSVVNPREVENFQKEIDSLRRHKDAHDVRLLELYELLPPAEAAAERISALIESKKRDLAVRRKAALATKESLEKEFKAQSAARPITANEIDPGLLARYEAIRQRHGGVGMAETVNLTSCGGCGTMLPERTLQAARDDKVAACETCHRILYYQEGLV